MSRRARRRTLALVPLVSVALLGSALPLARVTPTLTAPPSLTVSGCPSSWASSESIVQGDAVAPFCRDGIWQFDLPADSTPANPRRTEVLVRDASGRDTVGREGNTIIYEADLLGSLGAAGQGDRAWHVFWQLQGPTNGQWRPPPVGMQVRNGSLYLGGGSGHPNHDYRYRNYEWRAPLGRYTDNTVMRVRIEVVLSADPAKGLVSAWFNGSRVLDRWAPVSPQGNRPGTLLPGQAGVASRIGLYRGSQGESPPTYRQYTLQRLVDTGVR